MDARQRTALFYAARSDLPGTLKSLQHAGAILDKRDDRGYNALDAALAVGAQAAATELRAQGVHANVVSVGPRQGGKFDAAHPGEIYRGWPALALAVSRNDTASVQQLLDAGGNANLRLPVGDSLLQVAADAHAIDSLPLLVARGADTNALDHTGHTALWLAASRNDLAVIKALLKAGVKPDAHAVTEQTPLFAALRAPHSDDVVPLLLAAGANPDIADARGQTPLILAAANGQVAIVQMLLAQHVKTDAEDHERRTALWHAAAFGSRAVVVVLLAAGASREATDARGLTVLHAAAAQKEASVLAPLLSTTAGLNTRSTAGDTPLLIAAAAGHAEVVQALLVQNPELDLQNKTGDTALIAASRAGFTNICHLLLAARANPSLRNNVGVTAKDIAVGRGFVAIANELSGKG